MRVISLKFLNHQPDPNIEYAVMVVKSGFWLWKTEIEYQIYRSTGLSCRYWKYCDSAEFVSWVEFSLVEQLCELERKLLDDWLSVHK